jgi:heavy metal sensor kinase
VWYSLALAIPLVLFASGCYLVLDRALAGSADRFLDEALTAFSREVGAERRWLGSPVDALKSAADEVRFRDLRIAVHDSAGRLIARSHEEAESPDERLPAWFDAGIRIAAARSPAAVEVSGSAGAFRIAVRPLHAGNATFRLAGAYPQRDAARVLDRLRTFFLGTIPLLLLSAAVGGAWLAQRALRPVAQMAERAAEISDSRFDLRLPAGGVSELQQLSTGVNDLLDRLQDAFARQRRFAADASHELRTPAAIIRTEADVTLAQPTRDEAHYRDALGVVRDAAQRLDRVVDDLFLLARSDAAGEGARRELLYLEEVVHDAVRVMSPVAERHGRRIIVTAMVAAPVLGDSDLLGRAVLNLIDNAIKHAPVDSAIDIGMTLHDQEVCVSVHDRGPGIPFAMRERIFERFFRVDPSRARDSASATPGAGLGLAIARRMVEQHGGRLELINGESGNTTFALTVPLSAG